MVIFNELDWADIRKESPLAYAALINHDRDTGDQYLIADARYGIPVEYAEESREFNDRDLYDWFDERGYFISVQIDPRTKGFQFLIWEASAELSIGNVIYDNRYECELDAFLFAFKTLNDQLEAENRPLTQANVL